MDHQSEVNKSSDTTHSGDSIKQNYTQKSHHTSERTNQDPALLTDEAVTEGW